MCFRTVYKFDIKFGVKFYMFFLVKYYNQCEAIFDFIFLESVKASIVLFGRIWSLLILDASDGIGIASLNGSRFKFSTITVPSGFVVFFKGLLIIMFLNIKISFNKTLQSSTQWFSNYSCILKTTLLLFCSCHQSINFWCSVKSNLPLCLTILVYSGW